MAQASPPWSARPITNNSRALYYRRRSNPMQLETELTWLSRVGDPGRNVMFAVTQTWTMKTPREVPSSSCQRRVSSQEIPPQTQTKTLRPLREPVRVCRRAAGIVVLLNRGRLVPDELVLACPSSPPPSDVSSEHRLGLKQEEWQPSSLPHSFE
ncbi:hypothetical protein CDEST_07044 [Colletotrichum destructivum]|uniref:Uncharacterized protein n=1 Tax=Colletotrichum destructivum TaxID=34406 RepID=A0AAX4IEX5_9PEZI|nr:hypothetical protein CDEST_07044 [Colletotrichum destructivum]